MTGTEKFCAKKTNKKKEMKKGEKKKKHGQR